MGIHTNTSFCVREHGSFFLEAAGLVTLLQAAPWQGTLPRACSPTRASHPGLLPVERPPGRGPPTSASRTPLAASASTLAKRPLPISMPGPRRTGRGMFATGSRSAANQEQLQGGKGMAGTAERGCWAEPR